MKLTQDSGECLPAPLEVEYVSFSSPKLASNTFCQIVFFSNKYTIINLRQIFRSLDGTTIKGSGCFHIKNIILKSFENQSFRKQSMYNIQHFFFFFTSMLKAMIRAEKCGPYSFGPSEDVFPIFVFEFSSCIESLPEPKHCTLL